jgi:hypothetical protein
MRLAIFANALLFSILSSAGCSESEYQRAVRTLSQPTIKPTEEVKSAWRYISLEFGLSPGDGPLTAVLQTPEPGIASIVVRHWWSSIDDGTMVLIVKGYRVPEQKETPVRGHLAAGAGTGMCYIAVTDQILQVRRDPASGNVRLITTSDAPHVEIIVNADGSLSFMRGTDAGEPYPVVQGVQATYFR